MDKKIYKAVTERANGECEVCSMSGHLELHHILRRKVKETVENCIKLCPSCHRGTNGIHGKNGHVLDKELKIKVQDKYFKKGHTEEEVRQLMGGRIYIE